MDQGSSLNFDLNSQTGVMSLLASIRSSALSPAEKNELRDLVFLYTNGGGDVSVRIALEQKLAAHKISITTSGANAVPENNPAQALAFGSSRPAPVFSGGSNQFSTTTPVQQPVSVPPVAVATPPVPPPVYTAPQPQAPIPASVPVAQYVPTPAPQQPVSVPPVAVATPPVPPPVYTAPQPLTPTPTLTDSANGVNYLDRIREIKSAVNSKVGNPVNLVDINNEVGREYMNALLDAMKRLSGGATSQIDSAMQRLESAYQAVELAVAEHSKNKALATPEATPVVEKQVVSPVSSEPSKEEVIPTPNPISSGWNQAEVVATNTQDFPDIITPKPISDFVLSPEEQNISGFNSLSPSAPEPKPNPAPTPVSIPTPSAVATNLVTSLASEQRIKTPQDLPSAESLVTSATGDPLMTREIDDGLQQLLSDWSLFKKSGLFGTGPKGREHPLFKKIAGLQIPLVLAGRFEGSTQEIKQSITDYMNGWRYEQGIVYEQGETFEHYLRRVIRQILDLQKKRKPA